VTGNKGFERSLKHNPCLDYVVKAFEVDKHDIDLFFQLAGKSLVAMVIRLSNG